jgi:chemotaxis protein histidine kinase CheA
MSNSDNAPQAQVNAASALQESEDLMDAQLQEELRSMFEVDTQRGLETYLSKAANLDPQTWDSDIQTLYRMIHTIKGGAVTVRADAILAVSAVLEDLLSDLRHLETAPALTDHQLQEMLTEAGELLASTLPIEAQGAAAQAEVEPSVQRIQQLRSQIQQTYLPQWSEQQQIQHEFAQQGFDLVILDLEIAIEQLVHATALPENTIRTARQVIDQLYQIGQELQFASGWATLLHQAETLMAELDVSVWSREWPRLFQAMKASARENGQAVPFELNGCGESWPPAAAPLADLAEPMPASQPTAAGEPQPLELPDIGDFLNGLDGLNPPLVATDWSVAPPSSNGDPTVPESPSPVEVSAAPPEPIAPPSTLRVPPRTESPPEPGYAAPAAIASPPPAAPPEAAETAETQQVPVPLKRLDESAQALVTTLLSVRNSQGLYQVLHNQILQLVGLAQEGVQHITRLRQIQDDYALIDNLNQPRETGPTPERYRQGYTTINRLLETSLRLSELGAETEKSARQMRDSLEFLDDSVLKLQTTVEESRLVPFSNLAFRARAILRDLTLRFQKPTKLVIHGEQTELDVGTARSLESALLHLIRNAFDHALEAPEERQTAGKPEQGTVTMSLQRQGNTYRLAIQDDGRGLDPEVIRERALALGLPLTNTDTSADLLAVICQPGFSSATEVSDISGRGVGMDVVASQIAKLGGKLSLETAIGQGTTFHLQFPVPHLLAPCMLLQAGDRTFAVLIEDVKTLTLLEALEATSVQDLDSVYSWQIAMGNDEVLPGLDLMEYWHPQLTTRPLADCTLCACIHSADTAQSAWLLADELVGRFDLLITPLPAPLEAPEGLMGISLQPDGTLVPVLNAAAIVEWLHRAPQESIAEHSGLSDLYLQETVVSTPTILIVDDAALVRRRIEASLTAHGHSTHTCADGLEAFNWLQTHPAPALIITDIEMPNMDGFTLIDRCRQQGMKAPILVVSSRLLEDWFDEAKRLGANDYLTKGFSTVELINKVNELLS